MYDIITTTPEDKAVSAAVNVIIKGNAGVIPAPGGNYVYTAAGSSFKEGDGGAAAQTLVVVGHGSPTSLSGEKTWKDFASNFSSVDWREKSRVYVVACSTAGETDTEEEHLFFYKNFAHTVKAAFPNAVVWAAVSKVGSQSLTGDWEQILN